MADSGTCIPMNPPAVEQGGNRNGRTVAPVVLGIGGAVSGVLVAATSLIWNQLETARHEAQTALEVVAQHGQEFVQVREEIADLRRSNRNHLDDPHHYGAGARLEIIEKQLSDLLREVRAQSRADRTP